MELAAFSLVLDATSVVPKDFITPVSFTSLVGLSGITFVVSNACQQAFNFNPRWFALAIAVVATEVGVYFASPADPVMYVVGILNGCLVFLTATGATSTIARKSDGVQTLGSATQLPRRRRQFNDPWF